MADFTATDVIDGANCDPVTLNTNFTNLAADINGDVIGQLGMQNIVGADELEAQQFRPLAATDTARSTGDGLTSYYAVEFVSLAANPLYTGQQANKFYIDGASVVAPIHTDAEFLNLQCSIGLAWARSDWVTGVETITWDVRANFHLNGDVFGPTFRFLRTQGAGEKVAVGVNMQHHVTSAVYTDAGYREFGVKLDFTNSTTTVTGSHVAQFSCIYRSMHVTVVYA